MEKVLKVALDAEQEAQNIIANAMKEKEICDQNIADADKIKDKYIEIAKKHVSDFESNEKTNTQKQCEQMDRQLEQNIQKLQEMYTVHGQEWIDQMYSQITKKL